MKMRSWVTFASIAALAFACGDDEEQPASQPATVNKQVAASNAQGTIAALTATQSAGSGAGLASASSLASVAQSSQSLLQAQPGGAGTQSVASALGLDGTIRPLDLGGEGCSCTETSCTFTNCSGSASGAGSAYSFTVDGSYSWGGGRVQCNSLKYTFSGSSAGGVSMGFSTNVVVTLDCDITVTSTSINGFIRSAGSTSTELAGQNTQGAYSTTWDVKTTYNDVTFSAGSNQPTGGSLRVEGTTSVTAAGQAQTFAGAADVTFP